jgi:uncharacterized RDD family membrane protein YckC
MQGAMAKAPLLERFVSKIVDFLIGGALFYTIPSVVGPVSAITYILIADGLSGGQSPGKRLSGLRAVSIERNSPCNFKESIERNAVFALLIALYFALGWIPYVGKLLAVLAAIVVVTVEVSLAYGDEAGMRFGDRIAGTAVERAEGGR